MSWEIQRRHPRYTRGKSLTSAWAIYLNEEITVFHLVRKHSHDRYPNKTEPSNLTLFR